MHSNEKPRKRTPVALSTTGALFTLCLAVSFNRTVSGIANNVSPVFAACHPSEGDELTSVVVQTDQRVLDRLFKCGRNIVRDFRVNQKFTHVRNLFMRTLMIFIALEIQSPSTFGLGAAHDEYLELIHRYNKVRKNPALGLFDLSDKDVSHLFDEEYLKDIVEKDFFERRMLDTLSMQLYKEKTGFELWTKKALDPGSRFVKSDSDVSVSETMDRNLVDWLDCESISGYIYLFDVDRRVKQPISQILISDSVEAVILNSHRSQKCVDELSRLVLNVFRLINPQNFFDEHGEADCLVVVVSGYGHTAILLQGEEPREKNFNVVLCTSCKSRVAFPLILHTDEHVDLDTLVKDEKSFYWLKREKSRFYVLNRFGQIGAKSGGVFGSIFRSRITGGKDTEAETPNKVFVLNECNIDEDYSWINSMIETVPEPFFRLNTAEVSASNGVPELEDINVEFFQPKKSLVLKSILRKGVGLRPESRCDDIQLSHRVNEETGELVRKDEKEVFVLKAAGFIRPGDYRGDETSVRIHLPFEENWSIFDFDDEEGEKREMAFEGISRDLSRLDSSFSLFVKKDSIER